MLTILSLSFVRLRSVSGPEERRHLEQKSIGSFFADNRTSMEDDTLRARLEREEREARDCLRAAREDFDRNLSEIPSGLPQPDGTERIRFAGAKVRHLNQLSNQATRRLMDYLVAGVLRDNPGDSESDEGEDKLRAPGSERSGPQS